eukprot:c12498_g1_i2.p1 GENE.c12498_g1_i2~~c12498_g1_i2.p1  ORF type:complete len:543 (-),score=158.87 c12498_g1_i2:286-1914(-)
MTQQQRHRRQHHQQQQQKQELQMLKSMTSESRGGDDGYDAKEAWNEKQTHILSICIFGASGDLAKKKTYPALFHLYSQKFIGQDTMFFGYARTPMSSDELRSKLKPYLEKEADKRNSKQLIDAFLQRCVYSHGAYNKPEGFAELTEQIRAHEASFASLPAGRLFYLALPPNVFPDVATQIKARCMLHTGQRQGWNRVVVEKPFGHDLASSEQLAATLAVLFSEDEIYRIDHYLGKEMVQNIMTLRFFNIVFSHCWSRDFIQAVVITFKEPFGTEGRGGYFDQSGIIRDILQNHLLQVMAIIAMEPPRDLSPEAIRDEKTRVLEATREVSIEDSVLGQYVADGNNPGYKDDAGVATDSVMPTFATCVLHVDNARWQGVPFILKAGKATNERKADIRIQFKVPMAGSQHSLMPTPIPPNELVIRVQPDEAMYFKINTKTPGLHNQLHETEMDLTYHERYQNLYIPDAYERLILDVIRGDHQHFVRRDELSAAWKIFTPLLHKIEKDRIQPLPYAYGSRGPTESDDLIARYGYKYSTTYQWKGQK